MELPRYPSYLEMHGCHPSQYQRLLRESPAQQKRIKRSTNFWNRLVLYSLCVSPVFLQKGQFFSLSLKELMFESCAYWQRWQCETRTKACFRHLSIPISRTRMYTLLPCSVLLSASFLSIRLWSGCAGFLPDTLLNSVYQQQYLVIGPLPNLLN